MICPPDFVTVDYQDTQVCVMADYYSEDGIRKPLSYPEAMRIAQENGWGLPTRELVDAIWKQADLKLTPKPMTPGPQMTTREYYVTHNKMIEDQISGRDFRLVAGHKKDIIQQQRKGRVTIYGWHRTNGRPIQPVSSVHSQDYYDYSHGVRFVIWDNNG